MSKSDMPEMGDAGNSPEPTGNKFWIAMCLDVLDHHVVGAHIRPPAPEDKTKHAMQPFVVWLWMLQQATHKDQKRLIAGREVFVRRGQFAASQSFIAKFANWSRKATRVFLERLQKHGMIEVGLSAPVSTLDRTRPEQGQGVSVITICNYGKYQRAKIAKGQAGAKQGPARGQRGARITTVDTDTEDRDTGSQSIPTVSPRTLDAREEKKLAPPAIDLDRLRLDLSPRARTVITDMGLDADEYLRRARQVAAKGEEVRDVDVYCVISAGNSLGMSKRASVALLRGEIDLATTPTKKPSVSPNEVRRMSASKSNGSALLNTSHLKR